MEISRMKTLAGSRYLNFSLDKESYCMEILKVKELMGMTDITPLPQTPDFIRGVINLRGQIIPIIDLRLKFGLEFLPYHKRTSIIVVEVDVDGEGMLMGLVVDSIHEVIAIPEEKIKILPYINTRVKAEYIRGVADTPEGMKIVLDVHKILSDEEFVRLKTMSPLHAKEMSAQEA
ncbi:MAG: purine-binding chemotaxis protein CheW [Spirochaetales bacterium]|nr:purine-binding chemotaxis protein CheW [Spirochaetales bacterium]